MQAMITEITGTFLLLYMIFWLTTGTNDTVMTPFYIGLVVAVIICLIAPVTQACLNPARDFAPRMVAYLAGWGDAAFPKPAGSFFTVYILSTTIGGVLGALVFKATKNLLPRSMENDS